MAKKILKTLVNNLGFKILAVVLAFILWLVVYNIDDPKKSKTFTTNVTVENASAVTDMNKYYEVLDGTNTVTFTVTGKRSELEKLDDTDFSAVADMNRLIINDKGNKASVPIEISAKRTYTSVSINNKNKCGHKRKSGSGICPRRSFRDKPECFERVGTGIYCEKSR